MSCDDGKRRLKGVNEEGAGSHHKLLKTWQELAALTYRFTPDHPRFEAVWSAMNYCYERYMARDWAAFHEGAAQVRQVTKPR